MIDIPQYNAMIPGSVLIPKFGHSLQKPAFASLKIGTSRDTLLRSRSAKISSVY